MKITKIGFIGAGFVSQVAHLPSFKTNKKVEIVSICDVNKKLLKKVSKKYKIKNTYLSYKDMISNEELDGIVLSVQRNNTAKIAEDVIKSRIPLLSEKPAASSYLFAKKLCKLAKKYKTKYIIGYMKRYDSGIIYLKKYLDRKVNLGKLHSVYYESFQGNAFNSPFKFFKQSKSYIKKVSLNKKSNKRKFVFLRFLNVHCHSINLLRYLFGKIRVVNKALSTTGEGYVFFKKNELNLILNNQYSKSKNWIENINLNFEKGKITVKIPTPLLKNSSASITIKNFVTGNITKPKISSGWSFINQAESFINLINSKKNKKNYATGQNSLDDIKIIESIF